MTEEVDIEDLTLENWKRENESELREQLEAARKQIEALKGKQQMAEQEEATKARDQLSQKRLKFPPDLALPRMGTE